MITITKFFPKNIFNFWQHRKDIEKKIVKIDENGILVKINNKIETYPSNRIYKVYFGINLVTKKFMANIILDSNLDDPYYNIYDLSYIIEDISAFSFLQNSSIDILPFFSITLMENHNNIFLFCNYYKLYLISITKDKKNMYIFKNGKKKCVNKDFREIDIKKVLSQKNDYLSDIPDEKKCTMIDGINIIDCSLTPNIGYGLIPIKCASVVESEVFFSYEIEDIVKRVEKLFTSNLFN